MFVLQLKQLMERNAAKIVMSSIRKNFLYNLMTHWLDFELKQFLPC